MDRFAKDEIGGLKEELNDAYKAYIEVKQEYDKAESSEDNRIREISFLEYEINEINLANLSPGEDEELAALYKKYANSHTISEGIKTAYSLTGYDSSAAGDNIGRAVRQLTKLVEYDEDLEDLLSQATNIEDLLNDINRGFISVYIWYG